MSPKQIELARHALGLPNKKKTSYRNHFNCAKDDSDWTAMVAGGNAVMRELPMLAHESVMFYLTLKGAKAALNNDEHISREDAQVMHAIDEREKANAQ